MSNALALAPDDDQLRAAAAALAEPVPAEAIASPECRTAVLPPFGALDGETGDLAQVLAEVHAADGNGPAIIVRGFGATPPRIESAHAFDLGDPVRLLDQVKAMRVAHPDARIVLSPWHCPPEPAAWAAHVLPAIFRQAAGAADLDGLLQRATRGELAVDGSTAHSRSVAEPDWLLRFQTEVLACVDETAPFDEREVAWLRQRFPNLPPHRAPSWPLPPGVATELDADAFAHAHGLADFVLLPGPVVPEHNQLVALHALREFPCAVLGPYPDPDYERLCRRFAGPRTLFLGAPTLPDLAAAVRAARAVAFPTFRDRITAAALFARSAGTPVLCSTDSELARGLGSAAIPVDPCDVPTMRTIAARLLRSPRPLATTS